MDAEEPTRTQQSIPTLGAHDIECFADGGEAPWLAVANVRDDETQRVGSALYEWRADADAFVEVQRISTLGGHDWEALHAGGHRLLAVANQGESSDACGTGSVDVFWRRGGRFEPLQTLRDVGCAVHLHAFWAGSGVFLAVAIERRDESGGGGYATSSLVFEWVAQPGGVT